MNSWPRFLLQRALQVVPVLFTTTLLTFFLLSRVPGDPARVLLGERASEAALERVRSEMGLDQPWPVRYLKFLSRAAQGDLGTSVRSREPVTRDLARAFAATFELAAFALAVALPLGVLLGALAASRAGGWLDGGLGVLSVSGLSMPIFWLGIVAIQWFGSSLPFNGRLGPAFEFPSQATGLHLVDSLLLGRLDLFADSFFHLLLPGLVLATIPTAVLSRMTRASLVEVLGQDFIRTARAKGASENRVLFVHALKNSALVLVTTLGSQFGALLSGAVLTETIFSWPGLGSYAVQAVLNRDFPALQGTVLLLSVLFVVVHLVVDLVYGWLDPRLVSGEAA